MMHIVKAGENITNAVVQFSCYLKNFLLTLIILH